MLSRVVLIVLCAMLAACGGGGGGSSSAIEAVAEAPASTGTGSDTTAETDTGSAEQTAPVTKTADLEVDAGFALSSSQLVPVDVSITGLNNANGYLSVCLLNELLEPDYDNCMVQSAMPDSRFQGTISVSTAISEVASAIWFLDLSEEPIIETHAVGPEGVQIAL